MPKQNVVSVARVAQHLLPVGLLLVAILELVALIPLRFATLDLGGVASLLGPVSYLSVALAVVWVAFLPPSHWALRVTVLTAVVVGLVTACRIALAAVWLLAGGATGWSQTVLLVSGILLGAGLCAWVVVDVVATRAALADPATAPASPSPITHMIPDVTPASPSTPMRVPSPVLQHPSTAHPVPAAPRPLWQAVSTPWPRRDKNDADGTLIRPPQKHRTPRY